MRKRIRIVICNSSPLLRKGLKKLIGEQSSLEIVGEARTGKEAVQQVRRLNPDAVLMDVTTPELSGAEAIRRIKKIKPEVNVLVLTLYDDDASIVSGCLEAGASGYVGRDVPMSQLEKRITALCSRGRYQSPRAA
jgi:DNA-binding NarL/FixJ family response regulator